MNATYEKAQQFMQRNARPLDFARWQYHFENGTKNDVIACLAYYQNEDGGFGHALEADSWNPNSTPIQTWAATEILREIDFTDREHPIIQGILRYLNSEQDFTGQLWYNAVKSNNDYPHAPWWQTAQDSTGRDGYNPTACLAGFIIRFADPASALYQLGRRVAKAAVDQFVSKEGQVDMHTLSCYIQLLQYCQEADECVEIDLEKIQQMMLAAVKRSITQDTAQWENGYICKPSQFFKNKDSIFYAENQAIAEYECAYIVKSQLADGSWAIPWGWSDYPEQWALSKNWWKANAVINNLLYLRGLDK